MNKEFDLPKEIRKITSYKDEKEFHPHCNALLLQFKDKIIYDLIMPDPYKIISLFNLSVRTLSGEKINLSDVDCVSSNHNDSDCPNYLRFEKLNGVVQDLDLSKKLYLPLYDGPHRDRKSILEDYMHYGEDIFRKEWFSGRGTLYAFREGKRDELEKEVWELLPSKHIEKIKLIGDNIQPFIKVIFNPYRSFK